MQIQKLQQKTVTVIIIMLMAFNSKLAAQSITSYMRIARIVVDSAKLENYKSALKEGMAAAVKKEPGVLSLYAVYEKNAPTHITVFETYASVAAYQLHIQTAHFKKYKSSVEGMVLSLTLVDVEPVALEAKPNK